MLVYELLTQKDPYVLVSFVVHRATRERGG